MDAGVAEEAPGSLACLFRGHDGPSGEGSLPCLEVEDPGTDSSGSSLGSSCSNSDGNGYRGVASEIPIHGSGGGVGHLIHGASCRAVRRAGTWAGRQGWWASRRQASLLHHRTATRISCCTNVAARFWRGIPSIWTSWSSSIPWLDRMSMTVSSTRSASTELFLKICLSLGRTQSTRVSRRHGWSRKSTTHSPGWRLPTGCLGTPPAAHVWDAPEKRRSRSLGTMMGGVSGSAMTCSM